MTSSLDDVGAPEVDKGNTTDRFIRDRTRVFKSFLRYFWFDASSDTPGYSPHSTSLIKILKARSHNHLFSAEDGDLAKLGRNLDTPTNCIIVCITISCWGVALGCCGPLLPGKDVSEFDGDASGERGQGSKLSTSASIFQAFWSSSVAGDGSLAAPLGLPRRVSI